MEALFSSAISPLPTTGTVATPTRADRRLGSFAHPLEYLVSVTPLAGSIPLLRQ